MTDQLQAVPDSIERSIDINASITRVFELVSEPGWWINDDEITPHQIETVGDISTVTDPKNGSFRIQSVSSEPPGYVSFRWAVGDPSLEALGPQAGTLIEFFVTERSAGGVTVRVVESGFASLQVAEECRRGNFEANSSGWDEELSAAKRHLERS